MALMLDHFPSRIPGWPTTIFRVRASVSVGPDPPLRTHVDQREGHRTKTSCA